MRVPSACRSASTGRAGPRWKPNTPLVVRFRTTRGGPYSPPSRFYGMVDCCPCDARSGPETASARWRHGCNDIANGSRSNDGNSWRASELVLGRGGWDQVYPEDAPERAGRGKPAGAASRRRCTQSPAPELGRRLGETQRGTKTKTVVTVPPHPERSVAEHRRPHTPGARRTSWCRLLFDASAGPSLVWSELDFGSAVRRVLAWIDVGAGAATHSSNRGPWAATVMISRG